MTYSRSPLFYVGDKFKLLAQILPIFPQNIETFYEPFLGGGSVSLNVNARKHVLNDIQVELIEIHKWLSGFKSSEKLLAELKMELNCWGLASSYFGSTVQEETKLSHPKTYFAVQNRDAYMRLREHYNNNSDVNAMQLYILVIYGFNRLLRFNRQGRFNVPVGNVDFNSKTAKAIEDYVEWARLSDITYSSKSYLQVIPAKPQMADFLYFDPPYLVAQTEYNKTWNLHMETELLDYLDSLNESGFRWALSNSLDYRGKTNELLVLWAKKYRVRRIKASYLNYHNNLDKTSHEVVVTNYD